MKKEFFVRNRELFMDGMKDNSVAVFFAGHFKRDTNDQFVYPFSVDRNFYYLTGIEQDQFIVMLSKHGEHREVKLFILPIDEHYEKWQARMMRPDDAEAISGIATIHYTYEFETEFTKQMHNRNNYTEHVYLYNRNLELYEPLTDTQTFGKKIREYYPEVSIENSFPILSRLRAIKTEDEIAEIKKAVDLTGEALKYVAGQLKDGIYEYQVAAHYDFYLGMNGTTKRHRAVIASAENATILHYNKGTRQCKDGDCILMDLGAFSGRYLSDITRTFPISGKFTPRQREVYQVVYEALEIALGTIKAGVRQRDVNAAINAHYAKALKAWGLISEDKDVFRYYFHNSGHPIGLDLHDIMPSDDPMEENWVHTVEPGLYIPEWNLGVRLEDNVVVKKDGIVNLSANIMKKLEDVENFMA